MEWRDIKGYEGYYKISDTGLVKSLARHCIHKDKILSQGNNGKGYLFVGLSKKGKVKRFYIHRLVAESFLPNRGRKPEVNHKDGNKSNNFVSNLEWVTGKENKQHAVKIGLRKYTVQICKKMSFSKLGGKNPMAKKIICIETNQTFNSTTEAGRYLKVCRTAVSNSILRNYKCKGFTFRYI